MHLFKRNLIRIKIPSFYNLMVSGSRSGFRQIKQGLNQHHFKQWLGAEVSNWTTTHYHLIYDICAHDIIKVMWVLLTSAANKLIAILTQEASASSAPPTVWRAFRHIHGICGTNTCLCINTILEYLLKRECRHIDDCVVIDCPISWHFDNFRCAASDDRQIHQCDDLPVSVHNR